MLLALLACAIAGFGARDQMALAGVVQRQGPRPGLLCTGVLVSCATAAVAAWAAMLVIPLLAPRARLMFAALALAFGGLEALLVSPRRKPAEPTHSLGAMILVLAAHQISDAARFLVLAVAVATQAPIPAAIGGAIGGSTMMALAWSTPGLGDWRGLKAVRRVAGVFLLVLALAIALGT